MTIMNDYYKLDETSTSIVKIFSKPQSFFSNLQLLKILYSLFKCTQASTHYVSWARVSLMQDATKTTLSLRALLAQYYTNKIIHVVVVMLKEEQGLKNTLLRCTFAGLTSNNFSPPPMVRARVARMGTTSRHILRNSLQIKFVTVLNLVECFPMLPK